MALYSTAFRNALAGNQTNLLTNPNFTTDVSGWNAGDVNLSMAAVSGGQNGNCLRMINNATDGSPVWTSQEVAVTPGRSYEMSGYGRINAGDADNVMRVRLGHPDQTVEVNGLDIETFTEFGIGIKVPESVNSLKVELGMGGGTVVKTGFFDTLSLTQLYNGIWDILRNGAINLYSGTRPTNPDGAATGTLLATFSGLNWANAGNGVVNKSPDETWSTTAINTDTAQYGIFYQSGDNPNSATTTACRVLFTVGSSGAELNLVNTGLISGGSCTITSASFTIPQGT